MRFIIILGMLGLVCSCTHVVFDEPQPRGDQALDAFPAEFRGTYAVQYEDDDSLIVGARTVTIVETLTYAIPVGALDTMANILLEGGLLYDSELMHSEGIPYTIEDTMITYAYRERLEFGLSDSLVIKQQGRYLVVSSNFESEPGQWDVVLVRVLKSGNLEVRTIGNLNPGNEHDSENYSGDLADFSKVVPFTQLGENTFLVSPAKAQFIKLVRKNLFSEREEYQRIR